MLMCQAKTLILTEKCSGLMSITIPDSVTEISVKAFRGCTALKEISVKSKDIIDDSALPEGVKIIERG